MDDATRAKIERLRKGSEGQIAEVLAEIGAERAETMARLGRRLEAATARIAAVRADPSLSPAARREADDRARAELRTARWELLVVKEAAGLRGVRAELERDWPIPPPLPDPER